MMKALQIQSIKRIDSILILRSNSKELKEFLKVKIFHILNNQETEWEKENHFKTLWNKAEKFYK